MPQTLIQISHKILAGPRTRYAELSSSVSLEDFLLRRFTYGDFCRYLSWPESYPDQNVFFKLMQETLANKNKIISKHVPKKDYEDCLILVAKRCVIEISSFQRHLDLSAERLTQLVEYPPASK